MLQRLQKILAQWGVASRRQSEVLIKAGRVRVNGSLAHLGQQVDLERDVIEVDGQKLRRRDRPKHHYILLHKPLWVVSTCNDPEGRQTVLDLLPENLRDSQGLHPIGRLDIDSTGALLLTNDGDLTFRLTHPRYEVPKTYRAWITGHPSMQTLDRWRQGIYLCGKKTLPTEVKIIRQEGEQTYLQICLREGRNRQIRRVAEQLGHPVQRLHRIAIGDIKLGNLTRGKWRFLSLPEIQALGKVEISNGR